jgi:hypothetical protein
MLHFAKGSLKTLVVEAFETQSSWFRFDCMLRGIMTYALVRADSIL